MVMARMPRPPANGVPGSPAPEHRPVEGVRSVPVRRGDERRPSTELGRDGRLDLLDLRMSLEEPANDVLVLLGPDRARDVDDPSARPDPGKRGVEQRALERWPPGEGPDVGPPPDVRATPDRPQRGAGRVDQDRVVDLLRRFVEDADRGSGAGTLGPVAEPLQCLAVDVVR